MLIICVCDSNFISNYSFQEYEKLSNFIQRNYNKQLKKKDTSLKGWNWGIANFIGNIQFGIIIIMTIRIDNCKRKIVSSL